jgi:predicted membrane channel-forming protein YqfA (hemolysin III family)
MDIGFNIVIYIIGGLLSVILFAVMIKKTEKSFTITNLFQSFLFFALSWVSLVVLLLATIFMWLEDHGDKKLF